MWTLVPLGNPGPEYQDTRHNLGRLLLQRWMADRNLAPAPRKRFPSGTLYQLTGQLQALVPSTYMNLSGEVCAQAGVVLANLLLGYNIFKGATAEESRLRILNQAIPDFRGLDSRIDDRLNEILQKALHRNVSDRYPNADELLYDLEHYIYSSGYGPTNETLGRFIRELFGQTIPPAASKGIQSGGTQLLEHTARITKH